VLIARLQGTSLIDLPGSVSCVIYTQGCNLSCEYCHNPGLMSMGNDASGVLWQDVVRFLQMRAGFLDAVVFSGGEPTLHSDLPEKIEIVRSMGFLAGVHTNGFAIPDADYLLLSHATPEKTEIAKKKTERLALSVVRKNARGEWQNFITEV